MTPVKIYYNVSKTQLSIARMAGGCVVNGHQYVYNAEDDTLTLKSELTRKKLAEIEKKRWDKIKKDIQKEKDKQSKMF